MMFKSSRPNGDLTNRTRSYYELLEHKFKISSPRGFDPPIARGNYIESNWRSNNPGHHGWIKSDVTNKCSIFEI